ncbi:MAG: DUF262 domain-containing protein, partial [candidate division Zixibacteria bacterium]|nr:DUF262 domain-containing protein [candidate division Zixibacteria bacterium]
MPDIGIGNYQQQTLEQLLKTNLSYEVPFFQREFSWGKDDWDDLLEDINKAMKLKKGHFFGFMTFRKPQNGIIHIIEGQQRLATVTIFISVVRDILQELDDDHWRRLNEEYIKSTDPLNREIPPFLKLVLSEMNKDFFKKYIQEENFPSRKLEKFKTEKKVNLSNQLIFQCYRFFYEALEETTEKLSEKDRKDYLDEVIRTILREFIIITAEVEDSFAAYNIFQTLNDRGLDLTVTDLLKTYLFEKVGESWREAKEKWDAIREILSVINTNAFLRHYWLSTHGVVQEKHLLKEIANKIKNKAEVFKFLEDLKGEAEVYEALLNPNIGYWANKTIVDLLNELQTLTTQMTLPLLMAGSRLHEKEYKEFINILRLCISFTFRYLTIAEAEHKVLEKLFSDIAIELRKGTIKNAEQIKKKLLVEYPDDDTFAKLFLKKEIKVAKVAKYILTKIDDFLSPDKEKYSDKITLEHILPR